MNSRIESFGKVVVNYIRLHVVFETLANRMDKLRDAR